MNSNGFLLLIASILFAAMIAVNILANALPINGLSTGEVSNLYPSLFTPAGITFSIWSVIYLLLCGYLITAWTNRSNTLTRKLLPLFCASCLLNSFWILAWHFLLPGLSVAIMLGLLSVLIVAFKKANTEKNLSMKLKIWTKLPFTIYLAWISVATIANIAALLVSLNWKGGFLSEQVWTVIMMSVAAGLAFVITARLRAFWFSAVIMWALLGIFLKMRESDSEFIVYTSLLLIMILAINILYSARNGKTISSGTNQKFPLN